MPGQIWEVIGGGDKGGIIVREGRDLTSPQTAKRVSTGALVEEIEIFGERLHYKLSEGTGPPEGWISLKIKDKALVQKGSRRSANRAAKTYRTNINEHTFRAELSPHDYQVLRMAGTEAPGIGKYCRFFPRTGFFKCHACDFPLYSATSKFPDAGWDAYDKCFFTGDKSHVILRGSMFNAEAACANCGSHLGHVFYGEGHSATNERH